MCMEDERMRKIEEIKGKMSKIDSSSMVYFAYKDILSELEGGPKQERQEIRLKVHQTPEVCESCQ